MGTSAIFYAAGDGSSNSMGSSNSYGKSFSSGSTGTGQYSQSLPNTNMSGGFQSQSQISDNQNSQSLTGNLDTVSGSFMNGMMQDQQAQTSTSLPASSGTGTCSSYGTGNSSYGTGNSSYGTNTGTMGTSATIGTSATMGTSAIFYA